MWFLQSEAFGPRMARMRGSECSTQPGEIGGIEYRQAAIEVEVIPRPNILRLQEQLHLGPEVRHTVALPETVGERPGYARVPLEYPRVGLYRFEHHVVLPGVSPACS